ncbi:hypothetical protein TRVL_01946 [Trypanosoma vivax]|nr:hypothetical protein TRVL_01946 [Trypanosoma vivax]
MIAVSSVRFFMEVSQLDCHQVYTWSAKASLFGDDWPSSLSPSKYQFYSISPSRFLFGSAHCVPMPSWNHRTSITDFTVRCLYCNALFNFLFFFVFIKGRSIVLHL